ncbi:NAD(P)/FAD-dependent oxidoreductase [Albidovulum sediminicola]|uniref:FAD-dependent oxidoreductase n=1 Tax=Albidovulum sediminicola TaxID=2984331 RepID=A0ABT2Z358_9RHOB|nr:FAD-dependent oxidoreductase [Defluviimonas sp. WL0075]MCV2865527.1 FAD-dependent oxidoreductase [Defluviimonas sp. WL0075]
MTQAPLHVAIIGAGINGVATALWLQRAGHRVTILDPRGPAGGTSYGNGGVLASCSVVPVTAPGLLAKAPRMLLDPSQPLFLRWSYLPRLLPWLFPYLRHANAADARRIAEGLAPIVGDSLAQHRQLAEGTGAESYIVPCDYNFLYRDRAHYAGDAFGFGLRRDLGLTWRELEGQAWRDYEPAFGPEIGFAASFADHGRIRNPGAYVTALAAHVERQGGRVLRTEVSAIVTEAGRATGVRAGGETIAADRVVLTAGVWSGPLGRQLGLKVPLESERGYHIELWDPSIIPNAASMVASGKFVMTPMEGRLRLAGIVEFGGLDAPASEAPLRLLERRARAVLPGLTWSRKEEWLGHRPAPTDSLPFIGEVPAIRGAFTGFGHHHIGLTAGPRTGRILAALINGQPPNINLAPYAPDRFL